jgi:AcrR family transcriptional regulator
MGRQARSVETRARLLDAAAEVIARHGIEGASVDAISDLAERTSGSLYGQFGSKDALVVELLDESKDAVARRIAAELADAETLDARLRGLWRNFVQPPATERDWLRLEHELWVWATRPGNDQAHDRLRRRYRAEYALLAETLTEWTEEGLIDPPLDPSSMATVVVSVLIGLEMTHRLDPDAVGERAAVRALKALLRAET